MNVDITSCRYTGCEVYALAHESNVSHYSVYLGFDMFFTDLNYEFFYKTLVTDQI